MAQYLYIILVHYLNDLDMRLARSQQFKIVLSFAHVSYLKMLNYSY